MVEHKNKFIVEAWARDLLRQAGYAVKEEEPVKFQFIPDDCVGGLAIFTTTKRRREQAYVEVVDESVLETLASLVEFTRQH